MQNQPTNRISGVQALRIACEDAITAYRDIDHFQIVLRRESERWFVDFELTDPLVCGGGPHYVINDVSGEIISKQYHQ